MKIIMQNQVIHRPFRMDPVLDLLTALRARDSSWMRRRRKLDTATLFATLVQKCGHRGSVPDALLHMQLHDRANLGNPEAVQRATPAAVTRALAKMPTDTFKQVHEQLVQGALVQRLTAPPSPHAPRCVAIDGCHLRIPPALAHLREGCAPTSKPHLLLTCAVDTRTDVILTYDISFQPDERAALLRLVRSGHIPRRSCIIADRGYFSRALWREVHARGMFAVLRVRRTANGAIEAAIRLRQRTVGRNVAGVPSRIITWREQDDRLEPLLPREPLQHCADPDAGPDQPQHPRPPPGDWLLLTNTSLPPRAVVQMYVARWRIETVYRTLQSKGMGLDKHGGRECTIRHVIAAACLEHLLLRVQELLATQASRRASDAQHKAWATATSREHHHRLVDSIMRHLRPVAPQRRRQGQPHSHSHAHSHSSPPDPTTRAGQAPALLAFAAATAVVLALHAFTQRSAQLRSQSATPGWVPSVPLYAQ